MIRFDRRALASHLTAPELNAVARVLGSRHQLTACTRESPFYSHRTRVQVIDHKGSSREFYRDDDDTENRWRLAPHLPSYRSLASAIACTWPRMSGPDAREELQLWSACQRLNDETLRDAIEAYDRNADPLT